MGQIGATGLPSGHVKKGGGENEGSMEGVVGPRHDCTIGKAKDLGRHGVLMRVFVRMCVIFLFFFLLVFPPLPCKKISSYNHFCYLLLHFLSFSL